MTEEFLQLTLYSREGCHLCDDMLYTLEDFSRSMRFRVVVVDIDDDAKLRQRYNEAVPVLMCDHKEVCRHFFDKRALQNAIDAKRCAA